MKKYNTAIRTTWAGVGSLVLLAACQSKKEEFRQPNIIYIMSDDHAYQAISAYGYGLNRTPNIDRLAQEGALFTRSTVTNSISAPSRAVLLTGKHSFVNGKVDNVQPFDWDQPNFPKLMQANGYQTAMIGKIHLDGIPQGFDFSMVLPGQGQYYNPDFLINGKKIRKEGYCTDIITEATLDWLKNKRDPGKPFCVLYHQKAPHRNWQPAPEYLTLFDDVTFEPPATFFDNYEGRGKAAKEQEMQVHGHAMWGHDFKMIVDPHGDSTGFHRELDRFTPQQREKWLAAYTPKRLPGGSTTGTSRTTCAPSNRWMTAWVSSSSTSKRPVYRKTPLWCTPPTRDFTWENTGGSTNGSCMKSRSGPRC
jgi:hypothetical protein